ncbi:glycosyltransferase [Moellerella wisconsensis]|uniref:glycosyltransferase n=1 Tax=Moellerella wisconsensis TaxID=158849 RepID=UPI0025AFA457|nr:glycosyltransferase [Moellerella wisconsensis]WJW81229.1 glycosyltransferase [Moellerella wisconsensis]
MNDKFIAVAMSVYHADKPDYFYLALNSLFNQTYSNVDVYIQVDGPISKALKKVICDFQHQNKRIFVDFYPESKGLAFQLNRAISTILNKKKYHFIARMDSDDISDINRFQKQVDFFNERKNIAVLGSSIIEFDSNGKKYTKIMPTEHKTLTNNIIKRCPFNHPTVMFNLSVINNKDLLYKSELKNTQDYYLWVDLLSKGYIFSNISQPLLYFRVDDDFHKRRGINKAINDLKSRFYAMKILKCYSVNNFFFAISLFILRFSPTFVRKLAYKNLR